MNSRTTLLIGLLASWSAAAQTDAGTLFDTIAARAEGLAGGFAVDGGTLPRTLREYAGQPIVVHTLPCPQCPELDPRTLVVTSALAETGLPVVLLTGGKGVTKKSVEALAARLPAANVRIAYGKRLVEAEQGVATFLGSDGQPRTTVWIGGNNDSWALQAAAQKLLAETGTALPELPPIVPRVGEPFPAALVDGLLGSPDAGPSSLAGYLGQAHVIVLACSGCEGSTDFDALMHVLEPLHVTVVALASFLGVTREGAERLAQQVGPRAGLRFGWGTKLKPRALRSWSAGTVFVVDKHGVVRLARSASVSDVANNAWLIAAAVERAQGEP
jgi:hypothetical protein